MKPRSGTDVKKGGLASLGVILAMLSVSLHAQTAADAERPAEPAWPTAEAFIAAHPQARIRRDSANAPTRIFGRNLSRGATAHASAEQFRHAAVPAVFGLAPDALTPRPLPSRPDHSIELSIDATRGGYRFTAFNYQQQHAGLPVYGSRLVVLVRNTSGFPVVLANGHLFDLEEFHVPEADAVAPLSAAAHHAALVHADALSVLHEGQPRVMESTKVIFASRSDADMPPRLADQLIVEHGPEKWEFVVDASTGELLAQRSLICRIDLIAVANCFATDGIGADICESETLASLTHLGIEVDGDTYYTNSYGNVSIPGLSPQTTTVAARLSGQWFTVSNAAGPDTQLIRQVIPPGPAVFTFNVSNVSEFERAEVNAYVFANAVRDFVLTYNPGYPTLNGLAFPIVVNRDDVFCPGNAWYDIPTASLNFCAAGVSDTGQPFPNTAWSSVIFHEFGHHLVEVSGSGQGQYGEGFGDSLSTIMLDTPQMGLGFYNDCQSSLRTAEAGVSVPCDGSIHHCGQALSGCIWDTRNALLATNPDDYQDILADLLINSVFLHAGSTINDDLVVDFLTLDDDNGNIFDGTPHFDAIASGFAAHGMTVPTLDPIGIRFPNGLPEFTAPDGSSTIDVEIQPLSGSLESGQVWATFTVAGQQLIVPAQPTPRSNVFSLPVPAAPCGSRLRFVISAQATDETIITSPFDAPATMHESVAAFDATTTFTDTFDVDNGWIAQPLDATDGWWERGTPIGDFLWPYGPATDADGGGLCWLTANRPGNSDVDNGSVRLISPTLAMDVTESVLAYDYFLRLSNENGNDRMAVEMTDTVGPWVEVARHDVDGGFGWLAHRITPEDMAAAGLQPTGTVQIRFTVSDLTPQSIVEAGLDHVRIRELDCQPDATPGDITGDGAVNVFDLLELLDRWGDCPQPCPPNCPADLTDDCGVDVFDLLALLDHWQG